MPFLSLEILLNECYPNQDADMAIELIRSNGFEEIFGACISTINEKLEKEEEEINEFGIMQLGGIASSLLSGVNERIRFLGKDNLPDNLEQALSDVSILMFEKILKNTKSDKAILIKQLSVSLHDTCRINNYDEEELFRFLNFNELLRYASVLLSGENIVGGFAKKKCGYHWKGDLNKKHAFMALLSKYELIKSSNKSYFELFDPDTSRTPIGIEFNPDKSRLIMTFFFLMKNEFKCLSATKGGFYQPLLFHGIDFKKRILENKDARGFNDMIKKNSPEWNKNEARIRKWMEGILN